MPKYRAFYPRLAVAAIVAIIAVEGACRDAPTAPPVEDNSSVSPAINAPGDSGAPETIFLRPLGPRGQPKGELDTTLTPSVAICRLEGDACSTTEVARFTSDTSAPDLQRVQLTDKAYVVKWNLSAIVPDTMSAYRITVSLGDTTAGHTDVKIVPAGYLAPAADTAQFAFVTERRMLAVRFQIFMPPEALTVIVEPGVHGSLVSGTTVHRHGERVPYAFEADSGYTNVLVTVDQEYLPRKGKVLMGRPRVLVASADRIASVAAGDEWLVQAARVVLHSAAPVQAAQAFLDRIDEIDDTTNITVRLQRVGQVLSHTDPSALRALDAALAGHTFLAGTGHGSDDTVIATPPPWTGGGGGVLMNRLPPTLSTTAITFPLRSVATPAIRNRYEPLTIAYVNGVLTTPFGALFNAHEVAQVARASSWGATIPFDVRLIYNRTATATDADSKCLVELIKNSDGLGINTMPLTLNQCLQGSSTGSTVPYALGVLADFAEAGLQLSSILNNSNSVRPGDADTLAAITRRLQAAGRHIVFVPHSQGNLMVQQGLELLKREDHFHPATDSTCIGGVSLAAPASDNWPISPRHLSGLVAAHDAILILGKNRFPQIQNPLGDSADHDHKIWHNLISVRGLGGATDIKWRVRIHALVSGYLNQEQLRTRIQEALVHSYRSCALGDVVVSPQRMVLTTGSEGTFSASLLDGNGDPLDGSRGISWSGDSHIDWQRAVQVFPDGQVRARYVGGTSVQATTSALTAVAGVAVEPRPLPVAVAESLSARWVLIQGMMSSPTDNQVPSSSPPSDMPPATRPELPTPWNGDNCIAKTEIAINPGQVGQFSKECTALYEVTTDAVPRAARYDATFFEINRTSSRVAETSETPRLQGRVVGPAAILDLLPGPELLDRVSLTAWDSAGHLLASGNGCAHGCAGWPQLH